MTGIDSTKSAIHGVFGIINGGIKIAKSFSAIKAEIADLQVTEIVELVTQILITEIPAVIEEIKK